MGGGAESFEEVSTCSHLISVPGEEEQVPSPGPRETLRPDTHTY